MISFLFLLLQHRSNIFVTVRGYDQASVHLGNLWNCHAVNAVMMLIDCGFGKYEPVWQTRADLQLNQSTQQSNTHPVKGLGLPAHIKKYQGL